VLLLRLLLPAAVSSHTISLHSRRSLIISCLFFLFPLYLNPLQSCVISGFHHEVAENCALQSYYAASGGDSLPTFRDNL
jgi:hypothetical protein